MNSTLLIKGLFIGLLFIGTVSVGQFIAPTGKPTIPGSNSMATLSASTTNQEKVAGDLGANYFTATNSFCMNANCISDWWPTYFPATSCKIEVKKIYSNTTNLPVYTGTNSCESVLMPQAIAAGWVSTSFDYCTSLSGGNCNSQAQCSYMRLTCSGSVTTTPAVSTMYTTYPVTGAMVGEAYPFFVRNPECYDGLNNDGATGIDYPADPQCKNFADNSESS